MTEIRQGSSSSSEMGKGYHAIMSPASLLPVINQPYLVISEPIFELTPHQSTPWQQSGSYLGIEPALNYSRQMTGKQWAAGIACTVRIARYINDLAMTSDVGE